MTRLEQMDLLIKKLAAENPQYGDIEMPELEPEKWNLLRSLMNLRHPGPIPDGFLPVQDALLTQLTAEKGIVDAESLPPIPRDSRIALWQGDITTLKIEAIVNAANSAMLGCFQPCHSCIDNAIHTYAGIQLRNECDALMQGHKEPTGSAKITGGYNLPASMFCTPWAPSSPALLSPKRTTACWRAATAPAWSWRQPTN